MLNNLAGFIMLSALAVVPASAQCPSVPEPHTPQAPGPLNVDKVKDLLRDYHDTQYLRTWRQLTRSPKSMSKSAPAK
jgi:hypothetical protein